MFQNFFNSENPVFRFTGRVLDILVLSVMWVVCSLPIVTIGPASAALYYSCVKCLRYKEGGAYRSFLSAFKLNLKPGVGVTVVLLVLAVGGLMLWLLWKCLRQKNQTGRLVALSVIAPLTLQTVFSVMQNLGYILFSASMPLVTGNLPTVITMGLIGLALSVFREEPIAREESVEQNAASSIRLSLRNEKDAQNGNHVLGVSLIISRDGTKKTESASE